MQGNDFVTEDIVSIRNVAGDSDCATVVVGDEVVRGPCTWNIIVVDQASLINLEELQGSFVNVRTVSVAVSHVGNDWAVVARWPRSPLQLDRATGSDRGLQRSGLSIFVANDVGIGVFRSVDVAQIGLVLGPGNELRRVTLVGVFGDDITAVVGIINHDSAHVAVASHQGS